MKNKWTLISSLLVVALLALAVGINPSSDGRAWAWSGDAAPHLAPLSDRFSPEMQISPSASPEADRYKPAVAHNSNHNEYLVV